MFSLRTFLVPTIISSAPSPSVAASSTSKAMNRSAADVDDIEQQLKLILRHVTKRVGIDKDVMTYRLLSRELGITVQLAKKSMKEYFDDPQSKARGVAATWILSGLLLPVAAAGSVLDEDVEMLDEDGSTGNGKGKGREIESVAEAIRGVKIVQDADLQAQCSLFVSPPSQHIYSLSPAPLISLDLLTSYALPLPSSLSSSSSSPDAAATSKWKAAPVGGFGGIVHPSGERYLLGAYTSPKVSVATSMGSTATTKSTTSMEVDKKPSVFSKSSTSAAASSTSTAKMTKKEKDAAAALVASKPAAKVFRPMGSLGGLFAKSIPPPPPDAAAASTTTINKGKEKEKRESSALSSPVVVKKAKVVAKGSGSKVKKEEDEKPVIAKKKKTAGKSNGAFADEEVDDSDDDEGSDSDADGFDEEAEAAERAEAKKEEKRRKEAGDVRRAAMEEKKRIAKERMAASATAAAGIALTLKKLVSSAAAAKEDEAKSEKRSKELRDMMDLDDDENGKVIKNESDGEENVPKRRMLKPSSGK